MATSHIHVSCVNKATPALDATIDLLLAMLPPAERHRIRCDMRYDREIADARARGWTLTAARIEAERVEWLAGLGGDTTEAP